MGQASFSHGPEGVLRGITRWEIRERARGARQAIIASACSCMQNAGTFGTAADSGDASASDSPFLDLHHFVREYAHSLGALGHDAAGIAEQAVQAVGEACGDGEPDASVIDAVRLWCAEANCSARTG